MAVRVTWASGAYSVEPEGDVDPQDDTPDGQAMKVESVNEPVELELDDDVVEVAEVDVVEVVEVVDVVVEELEVVVVEVDGLEVDRMKLGW